MNKERLLRLANEILPKVVEEKFDMGVWQCDTSACAMGWACMDPVFKSEGLQFNTASNYGNSGYSVYPWFEGEVTFRAAAKFFGLSEKQAEYLFDPGSYQDAAYRNRKRINYLGYMMVAKEDVIERIHMLVGEGA